MEELMHDTNFRFDAEELILLPVGGGMFEVHVNDQLIFSKGMLARFPKKNEIASLIREQMTAFNS